MTYSTASSQHQQVSQTCNTHLATGTPVLLSLARLHESPSLVRLCLLAQGRWWQWDQSGTAAVLVRHSGRGRGSAGGRSSARRGGRHRGVSAREVNIRCAPCSHNFQEHDLNLAHNMPRGRGGTTSMTRASTRPRQ